MYNRNNTKQIKVGNVLIGGKNEVVVQSMTNTKTTDIKNTVAQINKLEKAGAKIVRVSVPDVESALAIDKIKNKINVPLVADIHFDYKLALMCVERGIDKIRINPGNIGDDENVKKVALACKSKNIPIRIGVNSGSISKKILAKNNNIVCAKALIDSAKENIKLLQKYDFNDIIVSIKSSDVNMAIEAYTDFAKKYDYPLHIGITEAGTIKSGTIKSSVGLGILLHYGIGDTMRVSLTGDPVNEIYVANEILSSLGLIKNRIELISCPTCARTNVDIITCANLVEKEINDSGLNTLLQKNENYKDKNFKVAVMGCAVNGPGEARECDIGIAGGNGEAILFKKGQIVKKVKEYVMVETLIKEMKKMIKGN